MAVRSLLSKIPSSLSLFRAGSNSAAAAPVFLRGCSNSTAPASRSLPFPFLPFSVPRCSAILGSGGLRCFSSSQITTSSLSDPAPNWSNKTPEEYMLGNCNSSSSEENQEDYLCRNCDSGSDPQTDGLYSLYSSSNSSEEETIPIDYKHWLVEPNLDRSSSSNSSEEETIPVDYKHWLFRSSSSSEDESEEEDDNHWLVLMEKPEPNLNRDEIIDSYIKTLAQVVGSEEEARMKIYSVWTKHLFAFGATFSEELSHKIQELSKVIYVLPHAYSQNKDCGGEPFIDGKAVPYDQKYKDNKYNIDMLDDVVYDDEYVSEMVEETSNNTISPSMPSSAPPMDRSRKEPLMPNSNFSALPNKRGSPEVYLN